MESSTQAITQSMAEEKEEGKEPFPLKVPKRRKKWRKPLIFLAVAAAAVGAWRFLRPAQEAGNGPGMYQPVQAQVRDLIVSVSGSGTLTPIESYQVRALVAGDVLSAPFEEGDQVEKGDLLYRIDAGDAELSLAQAQLSLRQAQTAYDQLKDSLTPAPSSSGVVQTLHVQKGDRVAPGTAIADIADTSTMTLTLPFQAADAAAIVPGQSAQVTIAGTMETLPGTVESVSSGQLVGAGGALVRQVEIRVANPGALTSSTWATASVDGVSCAGSGQFAPNSRQTVTAQTSGEVTAIHVTAGSQVDAGTALVTLGGGEADSALESASVTLENAKLSLRRCQETLENYTITAPISGTVIEKALKEGDKVNSMDSGTLTTLFDLSRLKLQMNVSELNIGQVQVGQEVEITAEALPGETYHGRVEKVSINGTTTNGFTTYPVTIEVEEYGQLTPGMNVSAQIIVSRVEQALCVPVSAVNSDQTVLVAGEGALTPDGSGVADLAAAQRREVTLGAGDQEYVQILSGLSRDEVVLVPSLPQGQPEDDLETAVVSGG